MSSKQIDLAFHNYCCAKLTFARYVAELGCRTKGGCTDYLLCKNALAELRPLLSDCDETVQQCAALALARLAHSSCEAASNLIECEVIATMIQCIEQKNNNYKISVCCCLRSIAKHTAEHANSVVTSGGICALISCLNTFYPRVKEEALSALSVIASYNSDLAWSLVNGGVLPPVMLCMCESDINVLTNAVSVLAEISKHCAELACSVTEAGAICHLASKLMCDTKLKRVCLYALINIGKHNYQLAELVVEAEIITCVFLLMKDCDDCVRKRAVILIKEIVKHTEQLATLVCNSGGIALLVDFISESSGIIRIPALAAVGYIASHNESSAMALLKYNAGSVISCVICNELDECVLAMACWALCQLGQHTTEHSYHIVITNILPKLLDIMTNDCFCEEVKLKAKKALKTIIDRCCHLPALYPLLESSPENILVHVLGQFSKVLPTDCEAMKCFVTSGGLRRMQTLNPEPGSNLAFFISSIACLYPEDIIKFYTPGYPDSLLEKINCPEII